MSANTHYAMVIGSAPPSAEVIAVGSREFCEHNLAEHLDKHPIDPDYFEGEILTRDPDVSGVARGVVVKTIADLMSEDGENAEYDRACVEIARDVLHLADIEGVEALLRALKKGAS